MKSVEAIEHDSTDLRRKTRLSLFSVAKLGKNHKKSSRIFIVGGYRVFIGNLGSRTDVTQLKKECERYGPLVDCWVAR